MSKLEFWSKKRLKINLTEKSHIVEPIEEEIIKKWVGGIGIGSYYYLKENNKKILPLDPENILYFCVGPLQGTTMNMSSRSALISKSPVTGHLFDGNLGGNLGHTIKFLNYDVISITGKSDKPMYLYLSNDGVISFKSAEDIWNKTTAETESYLEDKYGSQGLSVVSIGSAGENLVSYACLINDRHRAFGRAGAGAIFGSKNLKAIALKAVDREIIKNTDLDQLVTVINQRIRSSKEAKKNLLPHQGTSWLVNIANQLEMFPTNNFQKGNFEGYEKISGDKIFSSFETKKKGCSRCSIACGHIFKNNMFTWAENLDVAVPEYETIGLLGGNLGINRISTITHMNHLCDLYGLDTISTGASLSFIAELKQRELLHLLPQEIQEFNPEIPDFGEVDRFCNLIKKIAKRDGIGDFLAKGPYDMAKQCSGDTLKYVLHVKKLPFAAWDPRGKFLLGLSYATSAIGASHLRGWPSTSLKPQEFDEDDFSHQRIFDSFVEQVDLKVLKDSLIICHFTHSIDPIFSISDAQNILSSVFKKKWSLEETRKLAQRIWITQRMCNIVDFDKSPIEYDTLPERFMNEMLNESKAFTSKEEFDSLIQKYYKIRGLDSNGNITTKTKKSLDLE